METQKNNDLKLIPYYEEYMFYMIQLLNYLPRTEKFSIGTDFKQVMYSCLEDILYINKLDVSKRIQYLNRIDAKLNTQRIMLRVMKKFQWIDIRKFNIAMEKIYEIGKILGGLIKYYAKNNKKSVW